MNEILYIHLPKQYGERENPVVPYSEIIGGKGVIHRDVLDSEVIEFSKKKYGVAPIFIERVFVPDMR
jgi:hypothetical protein